nr:D-alanyl-D-alanine carboxypeptidase family protein [Jeotgalicoccus sp. WY2]
MKASKLIIAALTASVLTACSSETPEEIEAVGFTKSYEPLTFSDLDVPVNVEVIDGITYADGVLIVNKEIPLPADYNPEMQTEVIDAYTALFEDGAEQGLNFELVSGFRSYDYQEDCITTMSHRTVRKQPTDTARSLVIPNIRRASR